MGNNNIYLYQETNLSEKQWRNKTLRDKLGVISLSGFNRLDDKERVGTMLIIDVLKKWNYSIQNLLICRLDAHNNNEFSTFLVPYVKTYSVIEPKDKKDISRSSKIMKSISPDYNQPWIFFEPLDYNSLSRLLIRYWNCYGGIWLIMVSKDRIDLKNWVNLKKSSNYNVNSFMEDNSFEFDLLGRIIEDSMIDFFLSKSEIDSFRKVINEIALTFNIKLLPEFQMK